MARQPKPPLSLAPKDWAPFNEAFVRIKAYIGSNSFAARDLHGDALKGRLPSAYRHIAGNGKEDQGILDPAWWKQMVVTDSLMHPGTVQVRPTKEFTGSWSGSWLFFVRRADLDEHYPALTIATPVVDDQGSPARAKPGPKPHDWKLYQVKFYLMLYDDDILVHTDINASHYANRLMTWGRNNFGKAPEQSAMRENIAKWIPLWQRLRDANK